MSGDIPREIRKAEAGYPHAYGSSNQGCGIFRVTARKISMTESDHRCKEKEHSRWSAPKPFHLVFGLAPA